MKEDKEGGRGILPGYRGQEEGRERWRRKWEESTVQESRRKRR